MIRRVLTLPETAAKPRRVTIAERRVLLAVSAGDAPRNGKALVNLRVRGLIAERVVGWRRFWVITRRGARYLGRLGLDKREKSGDSEDKEDLP